jgi:parvulin-like peptidyl-prolyl isomerase
MKNLPAGRNRVLIFADRKPTASAVKYICIVVMAALFLSLVSCSAPGDKSVMRVGGNKVTYNEYRYFYMNYRASHDNAGETGYAETLKKEVEDALRQKYAKVNLAKENKVKLDDSDITAVDSTKESNIASYNGEEAFRTALKESALTEDLYYSLLKFQALDEKLRAYVTDEASGLIVSDDKTVEEFIYNHFIHATHILILNEEGDDISANLKLAAVLQKRAASGEDFFKRMDEYNEDPGMKSNNTGYYFTDGQLIPEFEKAAKALEVGEISDVVLSANGYHIIKRLPLDPDYINEHFEELRNAYKARMFNIKIEELSAGLKVEYTDLYNKLDDAALVGNTYITEG